MSRNRVSVADAKNRLPALIHEVEGSGAAVEITRRGKTVAILVSSATYQGEHADEGLVEGLARIRASYGERAGFTEAEARSLGKRAKGRAFSFDEDP